MNDAEMAVEALQVLPDGDWISTLAKLSCDEHIKEMPPVLGTSRRSRISIEAAISPISFGIQRELDAIEAFEAEKDSILSKDGLRAGSYPEGISLFDLMMDTGHDIISYQLLERLVEFWDSQSFKWHM